MNDFKTFLKISGSKRNIISLIFSYNLAKIVSSEVFKGKKCFNDYLLEKRYSMFRKLINAHLKRTFLKISGKKRIFNDS